MTREERCQRCVMHNDCGYISRNMQSHCVHLDDWEDGYDQATEDIMGIIQSRISEIIGDAQPKPILRAELQELIERIKEAKK